MLVNNAICILKKMYVKRKKKKTQIYVNHYKTMSNREGKAMKSDIMKNNGRAWRIKKMQIL